MKWTHQVYQKIIEQLHNATSPDQFVLQMAESKSKKPVNLNLRVPWHSSQIIDYHTSSYEPNPQISEDYGMSNVHGWWPILSGHIITYLVSQLWKSRYKSVVILLNPIILIHFRHILMSKKSQISPQGFPQQFPPTVPPATGSPWLRASRSCWTAPR